MSEPLCQCGHPASRHSATVERVGGICYDCLCAVFTPPPPARSRVDAEKTGRDEYMTVNGHHVVMMNHRFQCLRCHARLLSVMQFNTTECRARAAELSKETP